MESSDRDQLTGSVIGAAIEVHKALGPGLLENANIYCMKQELSLRRLAFRSEVDLPIEYKGVKLATSYRMDMVVEDSLVVEYKSVANMDKLHQAQLMTYLRLSGIRKGLLINFCVPLLKEGLIRVVM